MREVGAVSSIDVRRGRSKAKWRREVASRVSTNWLEVIPRDPFFVPTLKSGKAALKVVRELAPDASDVKVVHTGNVEFVSAMGNFEAIHCPSCGAELSMDWFGETMSQVYDATRFDSLDIVVPCCGQASSLNDLDYSWPQGFARWYISARDPGRGWLSDAEEQRIADALGVPVRTVLAHL